MKVVSYDYAKKAFGGGGTFVPGNAACQMTAPANKVEMRLNSVDSLPAGDLLMIADLELTQPVQLADVGFKFACDESCLYADIWTPDSTLEIWDGATSLVSQHVDPRAGTNRLMMAMHQKEIRVWLNGQLVATQSAVRLHGAGTYELYMENLNTTGSSVHMNLLQFAVYHLA